MPCMMFPFPPIWMLRPLRLLSVLMMPTFGEFTNEELFAEAAVARAAKRQKPENNNEGADDDDEEEEEHISNAEVETSLRKVRTFTQKQGMSATWVKEFFSNMEKEMLR